MGEFCFGECMNKKQGKWFQCKKRFWVGIVMIVEVFLIHILQWNIKEIGKHQQEDRAYQSMLDRQITEDIRCFPIQLYYRKEIRFQDDYGAYRESGGHEGCDILYVSDKPGVVPVVSATDGSITNLGWLYLGGYRIGITSNNNIYYYYAHFDSLSPNLYVGQAVQAGEFLGFMGNTGEGEEGTKGNFPVHLHFGIYVKAENGNEKTVNPYPYLSKNK